MALVKINAKNEYTKNIDKRLEIRHLRASDKNPVLEFFKEWGFSIHSH